LGVKFRYTFALVFENKQINNNKCLTVKKSRND